MRSRAQGFSLIEALIALLVVMLGLTGAARLQVALLAASANAKASDEATAFALDKLAEFQAVATYPAYRDGITAGDAVREGLLHAYRLDWQVEHHADPDYKRVDIRVDWPAGEPSHSIQIQSLIPGLEIGRFARQQLAN
jgi:type II secretory pathway pseudopilin PulG